MLIHDDYRRSGFGTYLLHLMGKAIVHRSGKDHAAIHLMANELLNPVSMSFYTKLGFKKYVDPNHEGTRYPKPVLTIKKCTSVLKRNEGNLVPEIVCEVPLQPIHHQFNKQRQNVIIASQSVSFCN